MLMGQLTGDKEHPLPAQNLHRNMCEAFGTWNVITLHIQQSL